MDLSAALTLLFDGDDTLWDNNVHFERAIDAFVEAVAWGPWDDDAVRDELDRVGSLVRRTSDFSSITPSGPSQSGVAEILHDLRALYGEALFSRRGIHFELRAPANLPPAAIPPEGDLAALTHRSMRLFAAAVARDDFSELYAGLATAWKRQTSAGDLRRTFATFVDKKIPLTVVDTSAPVFTAPAGIDSDGLLRVTGHYPTRPMRVLFTLHFLHEESQWRLAGIEVHTKQE